MQMQLEASKIFRLLSVSKVRSEAGDRVTYLIKSEFSVLTITPDEFSLQNRPVKQCEYKCSSFDDAEHDAEQSARFT